MPAGQRNEAHRQDLPHAHLAVLVLAHEQQQLHRERFAHRDDEHATPSKLLHQGRVARGAAAAVTMIASNGAASGQPW